MGDSGEPCGIPFGVLKYLDSPSGSLILVLLPVRKLFISVSQFVGILFILRLCISLVWATLSKAPETSIKSSVAIRLCLFAQCILSNRRCIACSHPDEALPPMWYLGK